MTKPEFGYLDGVRIQSVMSRDAVIRDYVLDNMNHVYGPRAYIRLDEFGFSMRTRFKNGKVGVVYDPRENLRWALDAPRKEVEMALFDLQIDALKCVSVRQS